MQVIIAGGGIAGLSLALSLHQIGVDCRIYEVLPRLEAGGLGINLQPNAVRELTALGLGETLANAGILTAELAFYNRHGQLIWSELRGKDAGYRWPQISISRVQLQNALLAAVRARLGPKSIVTGHRLSGFEERGSTVIARFVDPAGQPAGEAQGDLLVGADGIHSAVRNIFYPGENPVFDEYVHYRGTVEGEPFLTGRSMVIVGHRKLRAIAYPIAKLPDGKAVINWLAYTQTASDTPPLEYWDTAADKSMFIDRFDGWEYPWFNIRDMIARTERILQFPNIDRDPIPRWSFGRVTLVGDAAHPMQPIGGQAGSQAVVDGRVLAASLLAKLDPLDAVKSYESQRIAAMNAMILRNRNFGPEIVMQLAEERAPNGFARISDVLTQEELESTSRSFKESAGFDVNTVNSRTSYVEQSS